VDQLPRRYREYIRALEQRAEAAGKACAAGPADGRIVLVHYDAPDVRFDHKGQLMYFVEDEKNIVRYEVQFIRQPDVSQTRMVQPGDGRHGLLVRASRSVRLLPMASNSVMVQMEGE
jgi:hypothetical protein